MLILPVYVRKRGWNVAGSLLFVLLASCGVAAPPDTSTQSGEAASTAAPTTIIASSPTEVSPVVSTPSVAVTTTPIATEIPSAVHTPSVVATATLGPMPTTDVQAELSLGPVALGMRGSEVIQLFGEPLERTIIPAVGTPQWKYSNGLTIDLSGDQDNAPVRGLTARKPFDGGTPRGFGLGDTKDEFLRLYASFPNVLIQEDQIQVSMDQGIYLSVHFDKDGRADIIQLSKEG